ncbi:MAG: hypothetical protein HY730_09040 [Candidatus Tectomicrobia bacterium]|uniref:Transposase n=1 Tax=Tectimicrobiota bacterium TaxID=2528274 RepID=A0A933LR88_UNCTE|nr:hypothetical protein [Candidatus Tectomicrobia bacterium]
MLHSEYLQHLRTHFDSSLKDNQFWSCLKNHQKEFTIIANLNFDPAIEILNSLYSPVKRSPYRDPVSISRSLTLMTLYRVSSITNWVKQTRSLPLLAILAGFEPNDTPGVGTYYDFFKRLIDGPYSKPCQHKVKRSDFISGLHSRNLKGEKEAKKDDLDPNHSQSEKLADQLLAQASQPRPDGFQKILEDLLIRLGIVPSIKQGLLQDLHNLTVSGDGSILETAASSHGKPTCSCRSEKIYKCDHDRFYSSPTANWCHDAYRDCSIFGDRYYHLVVHHNGHDLPLLTIIPGGNESDYTLSLKAFDRLLKAIGENSLDMNISVFCGDGHHDSYAHYRYFGAKGVVPLIPLSGNSKKVFPHLLDDRGINLDTDGTPLCPQGLRMRHHMFSKRKNAHLYNCPVKRNSHRNGSSLYVIHLDECPLHTDCAPHSSLGPMVYIHSHIDPRLYPPIPRDSQRFKELMNHRTSTERCNSMIDSYHLDSSCRNADYGLIRLTLVNIVEHATLRFLESSKNSSEKALLELTLENISPLFRQQFLNSA